MDCEDSVAPPYNLVAVTAYEDIFDVHPEM